MPPSSPLAGEKLGAILIDDDPLVRSLWLLSAKKSAIPILAFASPAEFFTEASRLDFSTPIYIDSKLEDGVRGEIAAKDIFAAGFHEIYLVTGYGADTFPEMSWIRRVLPKDPPWGA